MPGSRAISFSTTDSMDISAMITSRMGNDGRATKMNHSSESIGTHKTIQSMSRSRVRHARCPGVQTDGSPRLQALATLWRSILNYPSRLIGHRALSRLITRSSSHGSHPHSGAQTCPVESRCGTLISTLPKGGQHWCPSRGVGATLPEGWWIGLKYWKVFWLIRGFHLYSMLKTRRSTTPQEVGKS